MIYDKYHRRLSNDLCFGKFIFFLLLFSSLPNLLFCDNQQLIAPCVGSEQLCFGLPSQCTTESTVPCKQLVRMMSMSNPKDGMLVEMFGLNADLGHWFAVGLSTDGRMGDDIFVHCDISRSGKLSAGEGITRGHAGVTTLTRGTIARNLTITSGAPEVPEGYLVCRWIQKVSAFVHSRSFSILDNRYHILLANGPLTDDGSISYHDERSSSPNPVSLQSVGIVIADTTTPTLIRLHGTLMTITWVGIVSLGIIIARHYKESWDEKTLCGVRIWFIFHRSLMIFAIIFAILGVISIFVHVGQWRGNSLHQYLGIISSVCMIFQPFGALFRCSPDSPRRSYFNWIHWGAGNIAHLTAMGTIFSVLTLKSVKLPDPFYWILAAHIVIYVAIHLIMQCHSAIISSKKRVIEEAHESLKSYAVTSTSSPSPASRVGEGFRQFMLGLYLVIVTVSTVILVLIIFFQSK